MKPVQETEIMSEPVAGVLARVAAELVQISHGLEDVSKPADQACADDPASRQPAWLIKALQQLDLESQRLACLATFLSSLSEAAPPDWVLDPNLAYESVSLSALAVRLRSSVADGWPSTPSTGECQLF